MLHRVRAKAFCGKAEMSHKSSSCATQLIRKKSYFVQMVATSHWKKASWWGQTSKSLMPEFFYGAIFWAFILILLMCNSNSSSSSSWMDLNQNALLPAFHFCREFSLNCQRYQTGKERIINNEQLQFTLKKHLAQRNLPGERVSCLSHV